MRPLSAPELLEIWERGEAEAPPRRAVLLLDAACRDSSGAGAADLPIGERDARLLQLREWAFGPEVTGMDVCPSCRERLEFSLTTRDLRVDPPPAGGDTFVGWTEGRQELRFRLPTSRDLLELPSRGDEKTMQAELLGRCLQSPGPAEGSRVAGLLTAEEMEALSDRMAALDPRADLTLAMRCPSCGYGWESVFDIVDFFWTEIRAWAVRILSEIHAIASAYGWPERAILGLSPRRRRLYLQWIGA